MPFVDQFPVRKRRCIAASSHGERISLIFPRRFLLRILPGCVVLIVVGMVAASAQSFQDGYPFSLPALDTFAVRFLPTFPARAIGPQEFISVGADGHFAVNGAPIRFFGTNCVADGAFPQQANSWFVAGRLRKMGYNLVRFHHMDNPWSRTGSLFEQGTDTRHLNAPVLDRLERFLAELTLNGIYADINLHVGRTFTKADGVPDADSIKDYGKGYTFFDPILIALQREYARQLLTHVNPYSGLPLVADPVMAMVEITNENSLYSLWRNAALRPYALGGILPMRHQHLLDSLWLVYLRQVYGTTGALAAAWNAGVLADGSELLTNGSYDGEPFPGMWVLEQHLPAAAAVTRVVGNVYAGALAARIAVTASDGTDWHVQWKHPGLFIITDTSYQIRFAVRADSIRPVSLTVMKDTSPYTSYAGTSYVADTSWRSYTFTFRAPATGMYDTRISFGVGAMKGTYWFDDVSMRRAGNSGLLAGETLDSPPRRIDFDECRRFTDGRVRDMTAFYMKLQSDFYASMRSFLRDSLGVRVPIVGTNWNFGAPDLAVQADLDYTDNHAYWDHPGFPGIPWSSTDWTITNLPMVKEDDGGTIGRLFGGAAMGGKPYTMSEYNHPFPNRYQSEAPFFLTAYAAFHASDAIMFYDYNGGTDWTTDMIGGYFDMHRNSAQMVLMPSLASAFRRNLIAPAMQTVALRFSEDDVLLAPKRDGGGWQVNWPVSTTLPLIHAVRSESFDAPASNLATVPAGGLPPFISDTRELVWNPAGVFTVGAPAFSGATGFLQDFTGLRAGDFGITSASDHATVTWIALDGNPLALSNSSLLTVATRAQNTGMLWDGTRTVHAAWGTAPTTLSPLKATFQLHVRADSLRVFPLTPLGGAGAESRLVLPADTNTFFLVIDQTVEKTPWYGIETMGKGFVTDAGDAHNVPASLSLDQNFPNPFNAATTFTVRLPATGRVSLSIFDLLGREVSLLIDRVLPAGSHSAIWEARGLASGVYVARLRMDIAGGAYVDTKKVALIR